MLVCILVVQGFGRRAQVLFLTIVFVTKQSVFAPQFREMYSPDSAFCLIFEY